ncbi:unnamed protein product [Sphagnum troendelagicum]
MAEGTEDTATISQKILYSRLPNQCRKCRRFGHHTRACITSRNKPWEGAPTPDPSNSRGTNGKELRGAGAPQWSKAQAVKQLRAQNARRGQEHAGTNQKQPKASKQAGHPAQPNIRTSSDVLPNAGAAPRNTMDASESLEADQAMADPATPPGPRQGKPNPMAGTHPENPFLEQPNFGYRSEAPHQTYLSTANANPFVALETINSEEEDLKHTQGETGEFCVFKLARNKLPEGDFNQREEQRLAKPPTPHQMHECIRRGLDPDVGS